MRSKFALLVMASALSACAGGTSQTPDRGLTAANIPVVTSANYVFDAAAPGGSLAPGEADRLDGWFHSLGLGYGDAIFVDGAYGDVAREQVAQIAGRYGLLIEAGAPITAGMVQPGSVRVVVSRRRAVVPGCPNWDRGDRPNYENRSLPNFGCAVNSNYAAMVADPIDLIHGREGSGVGDSATAAKAVELYRTAPPTGKKGLTATNTKGN